MRIILCTCPPAEAESIARALVEAGAACVNILPAVRSIYRWKGAVCDDAESLMIVKAADERLADVERRMKDVHPYELPEWIVLAPDELLTSRAYAAWVGE